MSQLRIPTACKITIIRVILVRKRGTAVSNVFEYLMSQLLVWLASDDKGSLKVSWLINNIFLAIVFFLFIVELHDWCAC